MSARGFAQLAFWSLLLLQPAWHVLFSPPPDPWFVVAVALLVPPAIGLLLRRTSALFWAALLSLPHFSHGIAEAWAVPSQRAPALAEAVLALLLVSAVGYEGLERRRRARAAQRL